MRLSKNWLFAGAMAMCLGAAPGWTFGQEALALAEDPVPVEQSTSSEEAEPAEAAEVIEGLELDGTLKAVDPDKRILLVSSADGQEYLFHYDDDTEVVGQEEGVQGLSGADPMMLHIEYRAEGDSAIIERIEPAATDPAETEPEAESETTPEEPEQ